MVIEAISSANLLGFQDVKPCEGVGELKDVSELARQFDAIFLQTELKSTLIEHYFNTLTEKKQEAFPYASAVNYVHKINEVPALSMNIIPVTHPEHVAGDPSIIPIPVFSASQAAHLPQQMTVSASDLDEKKWSTTNQSAVDFVKSIWPYVRNASNLIGLDPKVLIAQAVLETGWGQFIAKDSDGSSTNNLFNIKASTENSGQSVRIKTTEFINDTPINTSASFKKYLSVEQSLNDYISLIKNSDRYKTALVNAGDPKSYIDALQGAGYATDPNYADKIFSIYHSDKLQQALIQSGYAEQS